MFRFLYILSRDCIVVTVFDLCGRSRIFHNISFALNIWPFLWLFDVIFGDSSSLSYHLTVGRCYIYRPTKTTQMTNGNNINTMRKYFVFADWIANIVYSIEKLTRIRWPSEENEIYIVYVRILKERYRRRDDENQTWAPTLRQNEQSNT